MTDCIQNAQILDRVRGVLLKKRPRGRGRDRHEGLGYGEALVPQGVLPLRFCGTAIAHLFLNEPSRFGRQLRGVSMNMQVVGETFRNRSYELPDELVRGTIDTHIHSGPWLKSCPGRLDPIQIAEQAKAA